MLSQWISIVVQFALRASDPNWTCELTHRDPGMPATYYLYCSQTMPDGIEVISIGKLGPDATQSAAKAP